MAGVIPPGYPPMAPGAPPGPGGPFPGNSAGDLLHILEHIVGLSTIAQRERITLTASVTTAEDILLLDEASLLGTLTTATSVMARMKLKALKRWTERQETLGISVNVQGFTTDECRKIQRNISRVVEGSTRVESRHDSKEKLEKLSDKGQHWENVSVP